MARLTIAAFAFLAASHAFVEVRQLRFFQPKAGISTRSMEVFRTHITDVDTVLLGSSLMRFGITAPTFQAELEGILERPVPTFNLAQRGGNIVDSYVVARDLLRDDRKPSRIILGLSAHYLNSNHPGYVRTLAIKMSPADVVGPLGPRLTSRRELLALPRLVFRAPATLLELWHKVTPSQHALNAEVLARGGSHYEARPSAAFPFHVSSAYLEELIEAEDLARHFRELEERTTIWARRMTRRGLADFAIEGRATWAFEQLIALCQARGIDLLVLNMPLADSFLEKTFLHGEYATSLEWLQSTCDRNGVPFRDLNRPPSRPHAYFFLDGQHLSADGSDYFSRIVARAVVAPLMKRTRD